MGRLFKRRRPRRQRVVLRSRWRDRRSSVLRKLFRFGFVFCLFFVTLAWWLHSPGAPNVKKLRTAFRPTIEWHHPAAFDMAVLRPFFPSDPMQFWFFQMTDEREEKIRAADSSIEFVALHRNLWTKKIIVEIVLRRPLVRFQNGVLDSEGVVFEPLSQSEAWPHLALHESADRVAIARWLSALSKNQKLWNDMMSVSVDAHGEATIQTRFQTTIHWGAPDLGDVQEKAKALTAVLDDVHDKMGGTALADLRLFKDGRIVVLPKTAVKSSTVRSPILNAK